LRAFAINTSISRTPPAALRTGSIDRSKRRDAFFSTSTSTAAIASTRRVAVRSL
jgi:hypothetical protein